jgi:hypothetical protein
MNKFKWREVRDIVHATNGDVVVEKHFLFYKKIKLVTIFCNYYKKYSVDSGSDTSLGELMDYNKQFENLEDCKKYVIDCILEFCNEFEVRFILPY